MPYITTSTATATSTDPLFIPQQTADFSPQDFQPDFALPIGWLEEWDEPPPPPPPPPPPRRYIKIEQLREILKAQGSPWAKELEDTYVKVQKKKPKSKKLKKVLEEALEEVSDRVQLEVPTAKFPPTDWGPIIQSLQAAISAKRATLALKHAEAALNTLLDEDDAEAIIFLI